MLFSGRGGATGCSEGRSGERCDSWGGRGGLRALSEVAQKRPEMQCIVMGLER